jgi:hypothetical protein
VGQYKSAPTIEMLIFPSPDVGKVALNSTRASRNRPVIECLTFRYMRGTLTAPEVASAQALSLTCLSRD